MQFVWFILRHNIPTLEEFRFLLQIQWFKISPFSPTRYMEQRILLLVILVDIGFTEIKCIQGCFLQLMPLPWILL